MKSQKLIPAKSSESQNRKILYSQIIVTIRYIDSRPELGLWYGTKPLQLYFENKIYFFAKRFSVGFCDTRTRTHAGTHTHTHTHTYTHTYSCCILVALCLLLLTWSIAGIACRARHSPGTFFHCDTHTHTHTHTRRARAEARTHTRSVSYLVG